MFANTAELDFTKDRNLDDIEKACTVARGQLMLQTQFENSLWAMKQRKMMYSQLDQMPLQTKLDRIAAAAGSPRWSVSVSYANSRSFGPLDPFIEELYFLSEPGVTDMAIEVTCINHYFFLSIAQNFSSEKYFESFLSELTKAGLGYELMHREDSGLCGIEL